MLLFVSGFAGEPSTLHEARLRVPHMTAGIHIAAFVWSESSDLDSKSL